MARSLADQPMGLEVPKALEHQWDLFRLGIIATVEHMTCVLGKYVLYNSEWQRLGQSQYAGFGQMAWRRRN